MENRGAGQASGQSGSAAGQQYEPKNDYINAYTAKFNLEPNKAALVVVDMQYATGSRHEGLGRRMKERGTESTVAYRFERIEQVVVPNIQKMLNFCRANGIRVMYVVIGSELADYSDMPTHMRTLARDTNNRVGTRENEIIDELKPIDGEPVVRKTTISAFSSSGFEILVRSMDVEQLMFTGVSTNMCVETTARDAADRGFQCVMLEDCLGAAKQEYHDATLVTFQRLFGRVMSSEEAMKELVPQREAIAAR
ncbi:MAG: cysteine hydrolase [Chloroflexi bacterium]|nr:cysteine hydrolase [Chloroflexota bacterium]